MIRRFLYYGLRACLQPMPRLVTPRYFAVPPKKGVVVRKDANQLSKTLAAELQFEQQRYTEFKEGDEFLKEAGFTKIDTPESMEMKLVKNVGNRIVEIRYQAREPMGDMEDEEGSEEEGAEGKGGKKDSKEKKPGEENEEEDEKKENEKSMIDFTLLVKNKDGSGMLFDCSTQQAELSIYRATYSKNIEELTKLSLLDRAGSTYPGPDFFGLDEKVQHGFLSFIETLGVSEKLLAYIECSALDKEQLLYIRWLNDVKSFFSEN